MRPWAACWPGRTGSGSGRKTPIAPSTSTPSSPTRRCTRRPRPRMRCARPGYEVHEKIGTTGVVGDAARTATAPPCSSAPTWTRCR